MRTYDEKLRRQLDLKVAADEAYTGEAAPVDPGVMALPCSGVEAPRRIGPCSRFRSSSPLA